MDEAPQVLLSGSGTVPVAFEDLGATEKNYLPLEYLTCCTPYVQE